MKTIHSLFIHHKDTGMTSEEKKRTWETIAARTFLEDSLPPVRKKGLSRLYYGGVLPVVRSINSPYVEKRAFAFSFALGILIIAGSMSVLAEGALPGDALYSVKIKVNEKIEIALLSTPQEKAKAEAFLATKRLEEAEKLALVGKLDLVKVEQTVSLFNAHVEKLEAHLSLLETRSAFSDIAQVGILFQTRIAVHAAVLKDIEVNSVMLSSSKVTREDGAKQVDPHVVTDLESKVLPVVVPIVAVTKKAIVNILPASDREVFTQTGVRDQGAVSLFIDKAEAKQYITQLHQDVGVPSSLIEDSVSPIIPTFVP